MRDILSYFNKTKKPAKMNETIANEENTMIVQHKPPIVAFTDGSCINMKHVGYAVVFPEFQDRNFSEKLHGTHQTNNRAEYCAFIKAIEIALDIDETRNIMVYSDSELLVNTINKWMFEWKRRGWRKYDNKPIKNLDLVQVIDSYLTQHPGKICIRHVKAHTGRDDYYSKWNDVADKMAKDIAKPKNNINKYIK